MTAGDGTDAPPRLRWLAGFLAPERRALGGLALLSIVTSAGVLVQPFLTKLLIDDGLIAGRYDVVLRVTLLIFLVGLAATVLSGFNRIYYTRVSGRILFRLRETVYAHLQGLSPSFYAERRSGDILARLDGDVAQLQRFAVDSLFGAISAVLGLLGTTAFMLLLSWRLTLVVVVVAPLQWLYLRYMRPRVQERTRELRERASDLSAFFVETLPAMKFVQAMGAEDRERSRLGNLNRRYLDQLQRVQLVEFGTSAVPGVLTALGRAAVFLVGGYWVIGGELGVGALIAFSTYLGMAAGPIQGLLGLYMSVARVRVNLERVQVLLGARPDVVDSGSAAPPARLRRGIDLEGVSFRYPDAPAAVLEDASAFLPAGARIGLQSPSGAGKSTLADLLLRYYDPGAGAIRVDGRDLRELDLVAWRSRVALVAQDIVLFRGSLLDNIRYARSDASRAEVESAARDARLGTLLDRLPAGLDTPLGERGSRLSGGERQRLAIARALLRDPLLVILDEATSAVDAATEAEVLAVVDAAFPDRTRLVISHREQVLAGCDLRLEISDRRLIRHGPGS